MADEIVPVPETKMTKMEWFAGAVFKYFGSIFMEQNGGGKYVTSLGKLALAAVLAQAMWKWRLDAGDIVPGMEKCLYALMGYVFGTKGIQLAKEFMTAKQEATQPPPGAPQ